MKGIRLFWSILILGFLSLIIVGCTSLRPDPSIPALKVGYPSLEFRACNKVWHGIGICSLDSGDYYDRVSFQVQGYYSGTGKIFSNNCQIDQTFSYSDHELISIPINGQAEKNCLISVTLSPKYPKQDNSGIAVYSFRGHLAIKIKKDEQWSNAVKKVTGNWKLNHKIDLGGGDEVRVVARGCGVAYDKPLKVKDGILTVPIHEAVKIENKGLCVLEGVVIDPEYEDVLFTAVIAQYRTKLPADEDWYESTFSQLATAGLKFKKRDKIEITAPSVVSVISLDNQYRMTIKKKFKFDKNQDHIVRIFTVKGRSSISIWKAEEQAWTHLQ